MNKNHEDFFEMATIIFMKKSNHTC